MVPIYSITSWLALVFPAAEHFLGALRDCYEAYVVYTFFALLIAILAENKGLPVVLRKLQRRIKRDEAVRQEGHSDTPAGKKHKTIAPPLSCCYDRKDHRKIAELVYRQCFLMTMQFVLLKPILALLPFVLELCGVPARGSPLLHNQLPNFRNPRLYLAFVANMSVAVAFYGLLSFYHALDEDLADYDPWPKFLCIKGVVFMTFWQGTMLQFMSTMRLVDERFAAQLQNLLICIEMLMASLAHIYNFNYQEWQTDYKKVKSFRDPLAVGKFMRDIDTLMNRPPKDSQGGGDSKRGDSRSQRPRERGWSEESSDGTDADTPHNGHVEMQEQPRSLLQTTNDARSDAEAPLLGTNTFHGHRYGAVETADGSSSSWSARLVSGTEALEAVAVSNGSSASQWHTSECANTPARSKSNHEASEDSSGPLSVTINTTQM